MAQPDGIPHQKNIIRIDTKKVKGRSSVGTHGWQVKFQLNEQEISKFFSDKKYGGVWGGVWVACGVGWRVGSGLQSCKKVV